MIRAISMWVVVTLVVGGSFLSLEPVGQAEPADAGLHLVAGTLSKLDLPNGRGVLTTDLGRPIYFDVPNAYLFENVTVGARIAIRLDRYAHAIRVMDTSVADVVPQEGSTPEQSSADTFSSDSTDTGGTNPP